MKDVEGKIARAFIDAGMKVALTYRSEKHLDEAMKQLETGGDRVHAIKLDVTDRPGMESAAAEAVKAFGKVHVLVNNAGVALPPTLSDTSYQDWDWQLNVNLNGPFNGVHVFLPLIRSHGEGGQIISTSSALGLFASKGGAGYTVSKFAVIGMMEALRAELADTNIGASVLCPGLVTSHVMETSFHDRPAQSAGKDDAEILKQDARYRNDPAYALDPLEVGKIVLDGMRNNDLYILTSPEFEQIMRDRSDALMASIPKDRRPPAGVAAMASSAFGNSIYSVEYAKRRCAQKTRAKG
jgi:NAD(P)-dependent dehydrogenase (short-subunit alcohol dehydrogenase family)